jgi:2-succinyl-6-hydroxy-2,4-cyclohexadiene-1-carboxylate synthase
VRLNCEHEGSGTRIVLVHGFTQNCRCWGPLGAGLAAHHELVRVDAPGHGASSDVRADVPGAAALVAEAGGPAVYLGYSMGARIALHVALDHADVVQALVLVGGTAGIEDDAERSTRAATDAAWAADIRERGVEAFVQDWLEVPMFERLPGWARFEDERGANTVEGLASSLELAGTGSMAPRWDDLPRLAMPVLLVAGALDLPYVERAERMVGAIGANAQVEVIPDAGHAAHLEQPDAVLAAVTRFLG